MTATCPVDPKHRAPDPLTLVLAMPPSVNGLYANVARVGRVKTKRYKAWIAEAGWQLVTQPRHSFPGNVLLEFRFGPRGPGDASNYIKAPEDLLVAHRIITDDSLVDKVSAEWAPDVRGCEVTITHRET